MSQDVPPLTMASIKQACIEAWNDTDPDRKISLTAIDSRARWTHLTRMRQISMYLAKCLTGNSFPLIGQYHGNKDHTTVMHAFRTVAARVMAGEETILDLIKKVSERLECTEIQQGIILNPAQANLGLKLPSATESRLDP